MFPLVKPSPLPPALAGLGRTAVMGILNVTPDSFSDGGRWLSVEAAVAHAQALVAEGADLIDVGGESTRPGVAQRVPVDEERRRVLPVVQALVEQGITVSVDTMRASLAAEAAAAGATIINDVSGGLADPDMLAVMAETGLVSVLMHWRGHSGVMDRADRYTDVVAEVQAELAARAEAALAAGVAPGAIVLDPGLGFAKVGDSNWALLAGLDRLARLGFPLLIGASRKRFLATLERANRAAQDPAQDSAQDKPADRDAATAALTALVAAAGVWCVRVHAAAANFAAARLGEAWRAYHH
ncbi:MAG: dihydropteroate synthase [Bifidobacteriaceae bacterium]|jgi:dihydropteroate synthase|nr:dihydropteroate synthase [Bifidobacteriaceae bacterium]